MKLAAVIVGAMVILPLICGGVSFAQCKQGQIDINSASIQELSNLYGVGAKKAQAIIDARPYSSPHELTKAKGIGKKLLDKNMDKICVGKDEESE